MGQARLRTLALRVGRRLVAAGVVEQAGDVFYLHRDETAALLRRPERRTALVADRRADHVRWSGVRPPAVIGQSQEGDADEPVQWRHPHERRRQRAPRDGRVGRYRPGPGQGRARPRRLRPRRFRRCDRRAVVEPVVGAVVHDRRRDSSRTPARCSRTLPSLPANSHCRPSSAPRRHDAYRGRTDYRDPRHYGLRASAVSAGSPEPSGEPTDRAGVAPTASPPPAAEAGPPRR